MREVYTPTNGTPRTTGNLTDDVVVNATQHPKSVAFARRRNGEWSDVTAVDFLHEIRRVTKGLIASGVQRGDRVALLSRTRYEWTLFDYAIWFAGAVTVPIYETSSEEQIAWIIADSGADAIIVETPDHRAKVQAALAGPAADTTIWCMEEAALDRLIELGSDLPDQEVDERRQALTPESVATIIYTSGTTGKSKGCALTHGNFMSEVEAALDGLRDLFDGEDASTLIFLPLAHVIARVVQVGAVKARVRLGHSQGVTMLQRDLSSFQPTFILAVPRVFEQLFTTASQNAAADGHGKLFDGAVKTAIAYSHALERGTPALSLRARHSLFDRLVYSKLRHTLGGRCEYAISGGAPLGERLAHFYRGLGLTVLEGYGLTETTAALSMNLPSLTKIGSVGRPLPGTCVRVTEDGELLVRGGQVFSGYWNDDDATKQVFSPDGWLHTGDLGEIDDEGFLRITGRQRDIIVTASGKSVAPAVLEERIRAHPLVSQCLVVGDGQPYLGALVTIDADSFSLWAREGGKSGGIAESVDDPDLRAQVANAIAAANQAVSKAEEVREFAILPADWTEESGALSPSLKVRRHVVLREFAPEVEALFGRR